MNTTTHLLISREILKKYRNLLVEDKDYQGVLSSTVVHLNQQIEKCDFELEEHLGLTKGALKDLFMFYDYTKETYTALQEKKK